MKKSYMSTIIDSSGRDCVLIILFKPSSRSRKFFISSYKSSYKSLQEAHKTDIHTYVKHP